MSDNLKLFLHRGDCCAYVIANEVIGIEKHAGECNTPFKVFNLLTELYESDIGKITIPEEFYEIFTKATKIGYDECVLGEIEYHSWRYCLDFSLKINKNKKTVIFSDFILLFTPSQRLKLTDLEVEMNAKDAFYTMANICVTSCYIDLYPIDQYRSSDMIKKLVNDKVFRDKIDSFPVNAKLAYKFTILYLKHIKQLLEEKKTTPKQVLAQSGAFTLALLADVAVVQLFIENQLHRVRNKESLTRNEKIQYYVLFRLIGKEPFYSTIQELYIKNDESILQLEKDILKPFEQFWMK